MSKEQLERFNLHVEGPKKWDHTVSGGFGECERLGYYQFVLGLVPKMENFSFRWGKVHHKTTEIWSNTHDTNAVFAVIADPATGIPEMTDDRYGRNRTRMMELFAAWADFSEKNPLKVLRTEQPTLVACLDDACPYNAKGCGLVYGGRLDRIVEDRGIVGPLDVKTSVMDEADPIAEYKPSHQMEGYVWLASHLMGKHCWGVILEKAVCNKNKLFIKRHPISFSKDMIREWAENEVRRQARLKAKINSPDAYVIEAWEQNHFRCYKPFKCQYRDICTSPRDGDFRLKIMRDNYVEARWDFENPNERDVQVAIAANE